MRERHLEHIEAPRPGVDASARRPCTTTPSRWSEAAASFTSSLGLVSVLAEPTEAGCQAIAATHPPILTALPGATLLEAGEHGPRATSWDDLQLVADHRTYMDDPVRFLRDLP